MAIKTKLIIFIPVGLVINICLVSIISQFVFPTSRTLPNAKLFGQPVGKQKVSTVQSSIIDEFQSATVTIQTEDKQKTIPVRDLGAEVSSEFMTAKLSDYPFRQKLIPFSIFFKKPVVNYYSVGFAASQTDVLKNLIPEFEIAPKNAKLDIKNGKISVLPSANGMKINFDSALTQIQQSSFGPDSTTIKIKPEVTEPNITEAIAQKAYQKAVDYSQHQITISNSTGQTYSLSPDMIIDTLDVKELDNKKSVEVTINQNRLAKYLDKAGSIFYIPAKPTTVYLTDGQKTKQTTGTDGQSVDIDKLSQDIQDALNSATTTNSLTVNTLAIKPSITYQRSYSHTQKGLQSYLDYLVTTTDVRVSLKQLDGQKWSAGVRQTESTVSASTYKLFVAILVFEKINNNQLKMSDKILGTTVEDCLHQMLILSLNSCAEEWIGQFGRQNINNYFYDRGISSATSFTNPTATHTSAKDLLKVLNGIYDSSLLKNPGRETLLKYLAEQKYRKGIPSGTSGWAQDKIGFLWSYTHDAGVVHTSKGTYILAIMTKNSSFGTIADITRKIESIMYP
jgi:vancomycin resistance protein YoaR